MTPDRAFNLQEAYFDLLLFAKSNSLEVEGESIVLKFKSFLEALFYAKKSKDKEAMAQIDKALRKDPSNEKLLKTKALLLWELGSEEEVFDFLDEAKKLLPQSTTLLKFEEKVRNLQQMFSSVDSIVLYIVYLI